MYSDCSKIKSVVEKRKYQSPKLTNFGALAKLTQNGTGTTNENNGQGRCGVGFAKSGKTSC